MTTFRVGIIGCGRPWKTAGASGFGMSNAHALGYKASPDATIVALADINLSIWLPFLLAAAIKTAQGSSTVALITTASIMLPMMPSLGFEAELEKAMVVVAIGAGSAVVSHANDSFFWVVTQMSGMKVRTGYRLYTIGTLVLGVSAAFFLFVGYLLFT